MYMILEACIGNLISAKDAILHGAHQLELCDRLDLDGTSPPYDLVKSVVEYAGHIPVKVMINPKPYDYIYNEKDIDQILRYVECLKEIKISGWVFGPLDKHNRPEGKWLEILSKHTESPITFHKAIDDTAIIDSLEMLHELDLVDFVLTSGGKLTASLGIENLMAMKDFLSMKKSKINLIAAGSITSSNLTELHRNLNFKYYHGKRIVNPL